MMAAKKRKPRAAGRTTAALDRADRCVGPRAAFDPLKPDVFSVALDTREQIVGFVPLTIPIVVAKLPMGDLSVPGFEERVAIDRKQLGDFIGCVTRDRERFARLLEKMATLDFAAVVVEATMRASRPSTACRSSSAGRSTRRRTSRSGCCGVGGESVECGRN